jgi:hypothetical protein
MNPLRSCTNTQWNLLDGIISLPFSKVYVSHTIFEQKTVVLYNVLCFTHEICAVLMRKNFACFAFSTNLVKPVRQPGIKPTLLDHYK